MTVPFISVIVPVYNEERYLDGRVQIGRASCRERV